jgi:hypothetical protein
VLLRWTTTRTKIKERKEIKEEGDDGHSVQVRGGGAHWWRSLVALFFQAPTA